MKFVQITSLIAGVFILLFAVLLTGFGVLGLFGVLADVSPAENRQLGFQFLGLAAGFF